MTVSPLNYKYPMQIRPDRPATGGRLCWVAEHPDLPGCFGYGDTKPEAVEALDNARIAYITHMMAAGSELPPPGNHFAEIVEIDTFTASEPLTVGEEGASGAFVPRLRESVAA